MSTTEASEREAIAATVQKYIDGIANSSPDVLREAFHADAVMTGYFGDSYMVTQNAGEMIAAFMDAMPPTSEHSPNFQGRILSIVQHGTMAAAEIAEDQLQGKDMKTFFHLHKIDGRWQIVAKATWAPEG